MVTTELREINLPHTVSCACTSAVACFRVGLSMAEDITPSVIKAIWDCLLITFLEEDWRAINDMLLDRLNFPSHVSLTDGKDIVFRAPP